uniref:Uncharacterized protein n=1 Tax=Arundo donax TaxID=35708 RepID=A0A0A9H3B7_ARUDO
MSLVVLFGVLSSTFLEMPVCRLQKSFWVISSSRNKTRCMFLIGNRLV